MKVKARKTLLKYIGELANRGFLNYKEFKKIEELINNYYNGWGLK
jgi:2-hydroxy-3-keto-5-methylthiopentenyl-1-phosphate phosphatase